jgi:hypothetical protein
MTINLAPNTRPRRGRKVSQLAIEPVEYSAPMKLAATTNAVRPVR